MARITISPRERTAGLLPKICARCGRPTAVYVRIPWPKRWLAEIGPLIFFALPMLFPLIVRAARRRSFPLPLCRKHRADWLWRDRLTDCTTILLATSPYAIVVISWMFLRDFEEAIGYAFCALLAAPCVWIGVHLSVWWKTVWPCWIAEDGIRLLGVCDEFVRALRQSRRDRTDNRGWYGDIRDDFDERSHGG